jgi:hypothetical protein
MGLEFSAFMDLIEAGGAICGYTALLAAVDIVIDYILTSLTHLHCIIILSIDLLLVPNINNCHPILLLTFQIMKPIITSITRWQQTTRIITYLCSFILA